MKILVYFMKNSLVSRLIFDIFTLYNLNLYPLLSITHNSSIRSLFSFIG